MMPHLLSVKVPTLNVAGWWDQEDFYGPLDIYAALEKHDTAGMNYLVVGPWNHGGWTRTGEALGPIPFGSDTAAYFRDQVQAPFFAFFLKDKGTRDFPEALTFESRHEPVAALGRLAAEGPALPRCTPTGGSLDFGARGREVRGRSGGATREGGPTAGGTAAAAADYDSSSPTRRIRCRTGSGRSRPRTSPAGRSGRPGWSRISASWTIAPTCSAGRRAPLAAT